MGSLFGHSFAGTVALIFAFWNLRSAIRAYLAAPYAYVARPWHPAPIRGHWVRLAVYVIIFGTLCQLLEGLFLGLLSVFMHQFAIVQFEHALLFGVLVIMGLIFYVHDTTSLLPLPQGALHIIYAVVFFSEATLTTFHSISHQGLEPRYHLFQAIAAFTCFLLALLLAAFPYSFLLDTVFHSAFLFQGFWLWTMSLTLYGVLHLPGCRNVDYKKVICETEAQEHLGIAVAGIQFICVLLFTALLALTLYSRAARNAPRSSIEFILASTQPRFSKGSDWGGIFGNVDACIATNGEKEVQGEGEGEAAPDTALVPAAAAAAEADSPAARLAHAVLTVESESAMLLG
ncbi:hypothetical protein CLOM_g5731 [Closterium sp. NIES-68]|nr:hypothetical protein CLOM_g5731 [Closterium sp. NIES-68]GJP73778.1 hypothetical protein CLOP_g4462 [Closterium sp. NIES-67]